MVITTDFVTGISIRKKKKMKLISWEDGAESSKIGS
jgi:hypothetical protein